MKLSMLDYIAFILVIIGGINWGLVGTVKMDLVAILFGDMTYVSRVVYTLVGLSALYVALILVKCEK
jgi:uncharacterized membrane protein YuzA (DUF378 family)